MRSPATAQALVVSLHDVCPRTWSTCRVVLDQLSAIGLRRRSLLVIPADAGGAVDLVPGFGAWLRERQAAGDELVQHGLTHAPVPATLSGSARLLDAALARGAAEFLGLNRQQAAERLAAGRAHLAAVGVHSAGFTAPAWLTSAEAAAAVADAGFRYLTTHLRVRDLVTGRDHWSFGLSNRPADWFQDRLGRVVNEALVRLESPLPLIRVAIHPADLDRHRPYEHTLRLLRRLLRAGREPLTYLAYVERQG